MSSKTESLTAIRNIDHVGIAVWDADVSMRYFIDTLGLSLVGDEIADDPGVRLVYLQVGDGDRVQLVQPVREGPVRAWLQQRGEGLHHVCFEVASIQEALNAIPGESDQPVFQGGRARRACFLGEQPSGTNIELTETHPVP